MVASALTLWFVQSQLLALAALTMASFAHALMSMSNTSLQLAAPPRLRGVASAYYFVIVSLLGYGVGPTLVPLVSEHLLEDSNRIGEALAYISLFFGTLSVLAITAALHGFRIERGLRPQPGR
jgi:MFS family permease